MIWDPARYSLFEDLRTRPAAELLARVPHSFPSSVVDLGCGPGNSTKLLWERWPEAHLVGVDSSEEMLSAARVDYPKISFEAGDIAAWEPEGPVDVIFANAVLQWIPDHIGFLRPLLDHLEDDPERARAFMALYRESMREAYPRRADGTTLLLYPRLFAVATKIS